MRILQIIYESIGNPYGFGGAGFRAYEIYKRLIDRHDITFLCMKYPGAKDCPIGGINHIYVGAESESLYRSVFLYTISAARFIKRYGGDFDIIVENFLPSTPFFTRFLTKTPVVLQIQGLWGLHLTRKFGAFFGLPMFLIEKIYPRLYDTFLLVTDVNMNKIVRASSRFSVIPNGIDEEFFNSDYSQEDYILFLSRIDIYHKGLDILADAFEIVLKKYPDVRLVLAGHEADSVDSLIGHLPKYVRDRISYVGFVSGAEKIRLLSKARLFVLPSRIEAHPISIMEALGAKRAVVVSDIEELKFIGDLNIGVTFKSGSKTDLADKMSMLLESNGLRDELGMRGRSFASNYLWDNIAIEYEKFLSELV
ncbi:glycosyltransferase [Candidatus Magnetoovum chiemensis]|nr:glycosyltransferase [Candidatus Magnetoovum chiemensis]